MTPLDRLIAVHEFSSLASGATTVAAAEARRHDVCRRGDFLRSPLLACWLDDTPLSAESHDDDPKKEDSRKLFPLSPFSESANEDNNNKSDSDSAGEGKENLAAG